MLVPERLRQNLHVVLMHDVPRPVGGEHLRSKVVRVENGGKIPGLRTVASR
jgi:hypothetical protein